VSPFALVLVLPLAGAALLTAFGQFGPRARYLFANLVCLATAVTGFSLLGRMSKETEFIFSWIPGLADFTVYTDAMTVYMILVASGIGFLIALYSIKYMGHEEGLDRYYSLFLMFIGGMIGLVLTSNLLVLYFFWEVVGLCSYALIGFYYKDPKAARAGLKAYLTTRAGDVFMLIGIFALYFGSSPHTFDLPQLAAQVGAGAIDPTALTIAAFGLLIGAVGKSAQVPLHVWLPDAMEAPTTISALIHAATMVNAGIYLVARTFPLFSGVGGYLPTVMWIGVATAVLAALMALVEKDFKRLLAYSTVSQLGFMMFSLGVGGVLASQFHLVSHAIFKALLFLGAGAVIHEIGTRNMYEMGGLGRHMPVTAKTFLLGALALAGVPLFNGFFSKDLIFSAAIKQGQFIPLALVALAAVFTAAYALRAYYLVFCGAKGPHAHEAPAEMTVPLNILAAGALLSWLTIGLQSGGLERTGIKVHALTVGGLLAYVIGSPAFWLSLGALGLALLIFLYRRDTAQFARSFLGPLAYAADQGFWFDRVYLCAVRGLVEIGRSVRGSAEEAIDQVNYRLAGGFSAAGRALRPLQTGDLNWNAFGIAAGLLLLVAVIFFVG
jgi:NADH-quinone oxidoreductase subunit L